MKIKPEHYTKLEAACSTVLIAYPDAQNHYAKAGHSDKRFRWDILHSAKIDGERSSTFLCDVIYKYANDDHIDTALRQIIKKGASC